jgi:hypothetical protein
MNGVAVPVHIASMPGEITFVGPRASDLDEGAIQVPGNERRCRDDADRPAQKDRARKNECGDYGERWGFHLPVIAPTPLQGKGTGGERSGRRQPEAQLPDVEGALCDEVA